MSSNNRNRELVERALSGVMNGKLEPGTLIKAEVFEELLGLKRDEQAFGFLISRIRHALYSHGVYLSGEGLSETGCYEVAHPRDHYWIAKLAIARAERDLEGKQTLLFNTPTDGFSELERRRHENGLRDLSQKLTAMRRAKEISDVLLKRRLKPEEDEQPEP